MLPRHHSLLALLLVFGGSTLAGTSTSERAAAYIREAQTLCRKDNGRLWGRPLTGPLLFVDARARAVFASEADAEGSLRAEGDIFTGTLPNEVNIANTAVEWGGKKWAMMMLPLPEDSIARATLMLHELWHRIQGELGLPSTGPANAHLDTRDGRSWLQLEWRALRAALTQRGPARLNGVRDALLFRACRHELFPGSAADERELEMHEGLAEYTGMKLSGREPMKLAAAAAAKLDVAVREQTFVRSFAYASGPAYGILLDEYGIDWRTKIAPSDDPGTLLQRALALTLPADLIAEAAKRAVAYGSEEIFEVEEQRERARAEKHLRYRSRFIEKAVLDLPLRNMNMSFDPTTLEPLDTLGTYYPTIRITDDWGILTVTDGAVINPTFTSIRVSAPSSKVSKKSVVKGKGWTLELKKGWQLAAGKRKGDFLLAKKK